MGNQKKNIQKINRKIKNAVLAAQSIAQTANVLWSVFLTRSTILSSLERASENFGFFMFITLIPVYLARTVREKSGGQPALFSECLASFAEIDTASHISFFSYYRPTDRARLIHSVFTEHSLIASWMAKYIKFGISTSLRGHCRKSVFYGIEQYFFVFLRKCVYLLFGVHFCIEQNIL